jgi:chromosome segregation ATPase
MITKSCISLLCLGLLAATTRAADAPDPALKLREQLRGVMLQLRSAQSEAANAQAAQSAAELKTKQLADKLAEQDKRNAALVKQSNADKAAAEETIAKLNNQLAERHKRIAEYTQALEKWKTGYQEAAGIARAKEDERAKLAGEAIVLKRTIADREAKNIALFNTSNEILDRYEAYALGKALQAREPFIGTTRVKVENLVQGYKDKIIDNRISAKPPATPR